MGERSVGGMGDTDPVVGEASWAWASTRAWAFWARVYFIFDEGSWWLAILCNGNERREKED